MSASPGRFGGVRGLAVLRLILSNIGVFVLPDQVLLPRAHEAFAEDGTLRNENVRARAEELGSRLAGMVTRLAGSVT